jgi:hypothetical protein
MSYDYSKRGYLLPGGCKDLVEISFYRLPEGCKVLLDVAGFKARKEHTPNLSAPIPKITRDVIVPEQTSVRRLAALLGKHPSRIIIDLLELDVYSCVTTQLEFKVISKIARMYGYNAKRMA